MYNKVIIISGFFLVREVTSTLLSDSDEETFEVRALKRLTGHVRGGRLGLEPQALLRMGLGALAVLLVVHSVARPEISLAEMLGVWRKFKRCVAAACGFTNGF